MDDKLVQLNNFSLKKFTKENSHLSFKEEIINLFPKFEIISTQKEIEELEICFALCELSRNIKIMKIFFDEYLNIKVFEPNEYNELDLENPNAINLFEDIFHKVYKEIKNGNKKDDNIKELISECLKNSNKSINNLFRCEKCYDIMEMRLISNDNIEFKCQNCDSEYKELIDTEALKTFYTEFFCFNCKEQLILYKENYKCSSCNNLLCMNCKIKHLKNCFSMRYIKMYEVGFRCEVHNEKYIEYCYTCRKNLCESCKYIHPHVTKVLDNIDKKVINQKYNKDDLILKKNEMIKYNLSQIFLNLKTRKLFNGFLYEISCDLFHISRKGKQNNNIKLLNNDEFRNYYSKAIRKISKGKLYYLKHLEKIIPENAAQELKELEVVNGKVIKRENSIKDFIEKAKSYLMSLKQFSLLIKYDHKIYLLRKLNSDLLINIEKLNLELLEYRNANRVIKENTHNILSRFLADELLNNFI